MKHRKIAKKLLKQEALMAVPTLDYEPRYNAYVYNNVSLSAMLVFSEAQQDLVTYRRQRNARLANLNSADAGHKVLPRIRLETVESLNARAKACGRCVS